MRVVSLILVYVAVVNMDTLTVHRSSQGRDREEDGYKDGLGMHIDSLI